MKYFAPHDLMDCGIACLRMIAARYGRQYPAYYLRNISYITREGVSLYTLGRAAEKIGMKALVGELSLQFLITKAQLPSILYWDKSHFVVLFKITSHRNWFSGKRYLKFHIADPGIGKVVLREEVFIKYWVGDQKKGIALFLETTPQFYTFQPEQPLQKPGKKTAFSFLRHYFARYKANYAQVAVAMLVASVVSLFVPYLTQGVIDLGVQKQDIGFVTLIILFQVFLFVCSSITELVRSHLLLHISARVNLSILSDFLAKLMRLPVSYFESKMAGDVMQRVSDHQRIEGFISASLLSTFFSVVNMLVFLFVLAGYSMLILLVFLVGSILSVGWTLFFMKWRKSIDYSRFRESANANDKLYELVNSMPEIKLNSFEKYKQWEWQEVQMRLFRVNLSNLRLDQYQKIGTGFLDQLKSVAITFFSASAVIDNDMTLGMMLAIAYVTSQLNMPVRQMAEFITTYQSATIAIERMNEVYTESDEEQGDEVWPHPLTDTRIVARQSAGLRLKNMCFQYNGPDSEMVLKDIDLHIPEGKITAIVGSSGSGKTTLLKLLLKFFEPVKGEIMLDGRSLKTISSEWWRRRCGTVMQEGYIFADTIKRNIVMGDETENNEQLVHAVEAANISDFVLNLPLHFDTKIGGAGAGISTGQKQRILIARAVYKDPSYLFFDEATSALDARNERIIMNNLNRLFKGKTVVIIAHRLSTVRHADQIVVLEKGQVVETGTHDELVLKEGYYFNLVKNQLELGV
jgi:ATP-binding cassette, subfamily B, bacterial